MSPELSEDVSSAKNVTIHSSPASRAGAPVKGKGLSVASLVLGILGVAPYVLMLARIPPEVTRLVAELLFLAPIAAIVAGSIALAQKRLGRGMAIAGGALGICSALLMAIALATVLAAAPRMKEEARRLAVKYTAHNLQLIIEEYAAEHDGSYPSEGISWDSIQSLTQYYSGSYLINPYSGQRYKDGKDLFYFPDRLSRSGVNSIVRADVSGCPYAGLKAPEGVPGTIVVLGYTPADALTPCPKEYAIIGFARDVSEPIFDQDAKGGKVYFTLLTPDSDTATPTTGAE